MPPKGRVVRGPKKATTDSARVEATLQRGGFTALDSPKDFVCAICMEVWKEPVMLKPCQHIFCRQCLRDMENSSGAGGEGSKNCAACRTEVTGKDKPHRIIMNLVNQLKFRCNKCPWIGTRDQVCLHICPPSTFENASFQHPNPMQISGGLSSSSSIPRTHMFPEKISASDTSVDGGGMIALLRLGNKAVKKLENRKQQQQQPGPSRAISTPEKNTSREKEQSNAGRPARAAVAGGTSKEDAVEIASDDGSSSDVEILGDSTIKEGPGNNSSTGIQQEAPPTKRRRIEPAVLPNSTRGRGDKNRRGSGEGEGQNSKKRKGTAAEPSTPCSGSHHFYCNLCKVHISGKDQAAAHEKGRRHMDNLRWAAMKRTV